MATPVQLEEIADARFGDLPLFQSQYVVAEELTPLEKIPECEGKDVWVRAHVHRVRGRGRSAFCVLRERMTTVQGCAFAGKDTPKPLVDFINGITKESVVMVFARVSSVPRPVEGCTISTHELQIARFLCLSRSAPELPLLVEDAMRPESCYSEPDCQYVRPGIDTRLNYRFIDLRTPANFGIMRIRARIARAFRDFLTERDFVEINTPKMIAASSEGGAALFKLEYFDRPAFLAQSPQLYKQMAIAGGLRRVFEIGPVFRAEESFTPRHLTEFTGLDLEMEIEKDYHEVVELLAGLVTYIVKKVHEDCKAEMDVIAHQYPFEPLVLAEKTPVIPFSEGVAMLAEAGFEQGLTDDLSTPNEKALGRLVREKYGTDFYILDKFPSSARPFYTMLDPADPRFSNSYDMFLRGQEITSGAQRVHDPEVLERQIRDKGINPETLRDYIESFRFGCPPHGGAGLGLDRIVMLLLDLDSCRQSSMFPRTPNRITP